MNHRALQIWVPILLGVAVLIVVLNDWTKRRAVRKAERKGQRPERRFLDYKTPFWRWMLVVFLLVFGAVFVGSWKLPQVPPAILYGVPVCAAAIFLVLVVISRRKNRVHRTAMKLAQQGDVDGAIALLHEYMERNGPSAQVLNNLAVFQGMKARWAESLELIEQAELYGGSSPLYLGNKGLALWKLGRLDDALPFLKEAASGLRTNLITICNYGSVLAELGKHDEALEQLRKADQVFVRRGRCMGPLDRGVCEEAVEKLRTLASGGRSE